MKRIVVFSFALFVVLASAVQSQVTHSGDIWRWLPLHEGATDEREAQVVRGAEYVSIGIVAAHVSYRSGFLENIRQIVISSNVSFDLGGQNVQALAVNQTWRRSSNKSEDDTSLHDMLVVLSPVTPTSIGIKIAFAGIGEDRFKGIFDILSSPDTKTALNLSPTVLAQTGLITTIAQKFLASPYTDRNPQNILAMSKGFVIYPDNKVLRPDSLRQGYFIVISGVEKKNTDLERIKELPADAIRLNEVYHVLQLKHEDGSWRSFAGNSYIVLSVTTSPVRGGDQNAQWFGKFAEAVRATEGLKIGEPLEKVTQDARKLWQEGVTLLSADPNYIETERISIRLKALADIQNNLKNYGVATTKTRFATDIPGIPWDLPKEVSAYKKQLIELQDRQESEAYQVDEKLLLANAGSLTVQVVDGNGLPLHGVNVTLTAENFSPLKLAADQEGNVRVGSLPPGEYHILAEVQGFTSTEVKAVAVSPGQKKKMRLRIGMPPIP